MLVLVGCNHRSAPVAFRERLAFQESDVAAALRRLCERKGIDEAYLLSTCNRVEVLVRADVESSAAAPPPPVATARLTVADLPFDFRFEAGHSMTGGPWPEEVWVRARVDGDGRPGASPAGDLDSNLLGPVKSGSEGLALTFPAQ